jgi:hypothetical protein
VYHIEATILFLTLAKLTTIVKPVTAKQLIEHQPVSTTTLSVVELVLSKHATIKYKSSVGGYAGWGRRGWCKSVKDSDSPSLPSSQYTEGR